MIGLVLKFFPIVYFHLPINYFVILTCFTNYHIEHLKKNEQLSYRMIKSSIIRKWRELREVNHFPSNEVFQKCTKNVLENEPLTILFAEVWSRKNDRNVLSDGIFDEHGKPLGDLNSPRHINPIKGAEFPMALSEIVSLAFFFQLLFFFIVTWVVSFSKFYLKFKRILSNQTIYTK